MFLFRFCFVFCFVFVGLGGPSGGFGAPGGGFSGRRSSGKPLQLLKLKNHSQKHQNQQKQNKKTKLKRNKKRCLAQSLIFLKYFWEFVGPTIQL